MMANELDQRDAVALVALEHGTASSPRKFTFNGKEYPCAPGSPTNQDSLGEGGFHAETELELVADLSLLPATPPAPQDLITYEGQSYRVVTAESMSDASCIVLGCADAARGV